MSAHPDIGPELRALAQAILDRLDPAVRAAAAMASGAGSGSGKCQQVWCPVCALAALINGEQHPLLSLIAEHSVALMTMVRAMVADSAADTPPPPDGGGSDQGVEHESPTKGRYQQIPIIVED